MRTLFLTLLLLLSLKLKAQTWIPVPDTHFQTYLTANYPAAAFMTSGGTFFVDADHSAIQAEDTLHVSNLYIASLEGIQAFENLIFLDCANNDLTALPILPASLKHLACGNNQLTLLPNLPAGLTNLECPFNSLSSLPLLPSGLTDVFCMSNQLTSLPELPATLTYLYCSYNLLDSLPVLPAALGLLVFSHNQVDNLPVLPPTLTVLECSFNPIGALPAVLPGGLGSLLVDECGLLELPAVLPASLGFLACGGNQLTQLPVFPASLTRVFCGGNQLTELPDLPVSMIELGCIGNQISCFPTFPASLTMLEIYNNPFTCLPNYIPVMEQGYLNFPLCASNDSISNPHDCPGASGLEGLVFQDVNEDCISTGGFLTYIPMLLKDSNSNVIASSMNLVNGNYYFPAAPGNYELQVDTVNLTSALRVTCPTGNSHSATVPAVAQVVSAGDFGLNCSGSGFDLGVQSVVPSGWVFPGETHELSILAGDLTRLYNMNCASGIPGEVTIAITGPGVVTFGGSPASVSGNTAVYAFADFGASDTTGLLASVLTDTTAVSGQEFCVTVSVSTNVSGDLDSTNNVYTYCYDVVNSYDPNTKQTSPQLVEPGYTDEFTYTIHFQNTGSAPAMNIRLADTLDSNLDLATFKPVHASHRFLTTVNPQSRLLTFRFPQIMLPDSTSDPEGSIGFIQYRVKPVAGLTDGTVIRNTAFIYFDYNTPIITNTSENLFSETAGISERVEETIHLYPNPSSDQVFVRSENGIIEQVLLYDLKGTVAKSVIPNAKQTTIDISDLKSGIYFIAVQTNQSLVAKRLIVR